MASRWHTATFGEICEHSAFGPRFAGKLYSPDGNIATLRTTDISPDGRIEYDTMPLARLDLKKFQQHVLQMNDLVITRSGRIGTAALFAGFRLPVLPGAFLIRFRLKQDLAEPQFYRYFFKSPSGQELLTSVATGSVQQNLNITSMHTLDVPVPPLPEQRAISHILGTLDEKIELNRRMNETLEAIARAIFKSWFVDFDPVLAKAEGRDPGLPKHIADLFPDSFEDSELGEIPHGWEIGRFCNIVERLRNQENPLVSPDVMFHHFSIPAFDEGQWPKLELGESIKSIKSCVQPDTILLSKLNPEIERVWLVDVNVTNRAICSTEFLVLRSLSLYGRPYVYCLMRSPLFRQQIEALVTGTSKSHQRAQADSILTLAILLPPKPIAKAFDKTASLILERTQSCRRESRTLAAIRDALLPKLISGKLRIKDADNFIDRMTRFPNEVAK